MFARRALEWRQSIAEGLEHRAAERGNGRCTLTSTETARCFYRVAGYIEGVAALGSFGMLGYPVSKFLSGPMSD